MNWKLWNHWNISREEARHLTLELIFALGKKLPSKRLLKVKFSPCHTLKMHMQMKLKARNTLSATPRIVGYSGTISGFVLREDRKRHRLIPKLGFLTAALYWHFVDVVWILLFIVIYICL